MGRWKKYPDVERRLLELLDSTNEGMRFNELFTKLKPGSKTTLSESLRNLVTAGLIEHDYLTENFKATENGKQVIERTRLGQRDMSFLIDSEVFSERWYAVEAAIHLWYGLLNYHKEQQDMSFLPINMDRDGNVIGIPESEKDWKLLEKSLGMRQKIKRDIDYNLIQILQTFIKKHRSDAAMIPWKSKENVKGLWDSAWPREVINDLILAFASDREIANAGINGLKEFLTAKYADKINRSNLQREFTYERIQAFKKGHPSKIQVGKD